MITRAKISGLRANSFVVGEQFYNVQWILKFFDSFPGFMEFLESRAALINFFVPHAALIRGQRLFDKYGMPWRKVGWDLITKLQPISQKLQKH